MTIRVHIVAHEGCGASMPVSMFDLLSRIFAMHRKPIDLKLVSAGRTRHLTAAFGVKLTCDATLATAGPCDLAIIAPLDHDPEANLAKNRRLVPWLADAHANGADLASACTGAYALAMAGLLDGKLATTHWAFQARFAECFPQVRVAPHAVVVDQGRIITAGGATSYINLTLLLIERLLGPEVMRSASKFFLIDPNKSPQGAYAAFSTQKGHGDDEILKAQNLIERDVRKAPGVAELAKRVALGDRTFARRFHAATGNTPRDYIQRVRIEAAKRALEEGRAVTGVAKQVGYGDPVAFRRLFSRLTGLTPAEYRSRYASGVRSTA